MLPVRTGGYGLSGTHKVAFAYNVKLTDIPELSERGRHPLHWERNCRCPLLDWKLDVMRRSVEAWD